MKKLIFPAIMLAMIWPEMLVRAQEGQHWQPKPSTTWQIQLTGEVEPDTVHPVTMVDLDLFDTAQETIAALKARGHIVICYFSAGSYEDWRPDASSFPVHVIGKPLEGWPGEYWLDIRQLGILKPIMTARLDLASAKGCDGVDPDNVDGYINETGFPLDYQDQLTYNRWLAEEAHKRGLSIGLKNDLDQIGGLVEYFDWALNEQCFEYGECSQLLPFIEADKAVFGISYTGDPAEICPQANALGFSWLFKTPELDARVVADCADFDRWSPKK